MGNREFVLDALKKLQELKKEDFYDYGYIDAFEFLGKTKSDLYDYLSKQKGVKKVKGEENISNNWVEEWSPTDSLYFGRHQIYYSCRRGTFFYPLPEDLLCFEGMKSMILSEKEIERHDKEWALIDQLTKKNKQLDILESKKQNAEKKLNNYSKVKFLFWLKIKMLKKEIDDCSKEIEKIEKERQEISEDIQEYRALHFVVSDEVVQELCDSCCEMNKRINEANAEKEKVAEEYKQSRIEKEQAKEENKRNQIRILESLLTPELLDELESYVSSSSLDDEGLVEIANEVLAAGGRGKKRITI